MIRRKIPIALFTLFCLTVICQVSLLDKRFTFSDINPDCPWCDTLNTEDELIHLPVNPSAARMAAPADPGFTADLIWLRTSYYFGVHALTDNRYFFLHYLLDLITDLSPRWELPYVFGAVALPVASEAADDALYLLDKGIANNPETWKLLFLKGYILWQYKKEPVRAAEAFFTASLMKGAPKYLASLSATLATRAGERELALRFIAMALQSIEDPLYQKMLLDKAGDLIHNE